MHLLQVAVCVWTCCCCCCCCCSAAAAPREPLRDDAVACVKERLLNATVHPRGGESARDLILAALAESDVDLATRPADPEAWCSRMAAQLEPLLLKRWAFQDRVGKLLRDSLGVGDWGKMPTAAERRRMYYSIPEAIIHRVNRWNSRPQRRVTEDILFIGSLGTAVTLDNRTVETRSFLLDRGLTQRRIRRVRLSLHSASDEVSRWRGRRLRLRLVEASRRRPGRVLLQPVVRQFRVPADAAEVAVDVTTCVSDALRHLKATAGATEIEVAFVVDCADCAGRRRPRIPFAVMDVTADVGRSRRRFRRSAQTAVPTTRRCQRHDAAAGVGDAARKGCCISTFEYDLSTMRGVISPRQLTISYCTGHCHAESHVKTVHSGFKQALAHSQSSSLTYAQRQDLQLCCVPDQYRGFKVLMGNPSDPFKAEIREIPELSVESCICA